MIEEQKISHTLQFLIEERNVKAVSEAISEVEAVDIAKIFEILEEEDQKFLYEIMDNERSAEVLLYIDEDARKKFLRNFSTKEIADNIINEIDSDDAADIIAELPEYQQDEIIFKQIVKTGFGQRRKKLSNALKSLDIPEVLKSHAFMDKRAEELSVEDFINFTKEWKAAKN